MSRVGATALLAGIGGVVGLVLGTSLLVAIQVIEDGAFSWDPTVPFALLFGGTVGAAVGAIGAPMITWLLLRRVPLNRAIIFCALGTIAGEAIGVATFGQLVLGGCVGFVASAILLRIVYRTPTAV